CLSDWSSDVCSSDLVTDERHRDRAVGPHGRLRVEILLIPDVDVEDVADADDGRLRADVRESILREVSDRLGRRSAGAENDQRHEIGRAAWRERGWDP